MNRLDDENLTTSKKVIRKLYLDGTDFVTNITVAANAREIYRRGQDLKGSANRQELLNVTAKDDLLKFNQIIKKLDEAKSAKSSHRIYQLLEEQKSACNQLINDKNRVIKFISEGLRVKEAAFVQEIKKQEDDIKLISLRIDKLIEILSASSSKELQSIERHLEDNYEAVLTEKEKEWKNSILKTREYQFKAISERQRMTFEYEQALEELKTESFENFRKLNLQLDRETRDLRKELTRVRGISLINEEKLEYSLEVLKKQEEENSHILNGQKRTKTKLHDAMVKCQKDLETVQLKGLKSVIKLKREKEFISGKVRNNQTQLNKFVSTELKIQKNVWLTNEELIKYHLHQLLDADKYIMEKILYTTWNKPDISFANNVGPIYHNSNSLIDGNINYNTEIKSANEINNYEELLPLDIILKMISEEMSFLIEDDLKNILDPGENNFQSLDAILRVLKVETQEDMDVLKSTFLAQLPVDVTHENVQSKIDTAKAIEDFLSIRNTHRLLGKRETEIQTEELNESATKEYWKKYTNVISSEKCEFWENVNLALQKYKKLLTQQLSLRDKKKLLVTQNEEFRIILGENLFN